MTIRELRRAAKRKIEVLPPDKLKIAAEFVAYLEDRASAEATQELLKIPGLLEDLKKAEAEIADGKGRDWRKVRRDV